MSESESRGSGGGFGTALVLIPLLWGVYQTLLGVVALFS